MRYATQKSLWGKGMLLGATLIWGSSFIILKNTIEDLPVCSVSPKERLIQIQPNRCRTENNKIPKEPPLGFCD